MQIDVVLRAAQNAKGATRYTQAQIDQFLDAHERFVLRQPHGMRAIMRNLQAPGMTFADRNLREADFTGANLQSVAMSRADLERATLFCVDLSDADVRDANLRRADIRGASLRNANLSGCTLDDADMRQAVLARTDVPEGFRVIGRSQASTTGEDEMAFSVDFTNASLRGARLANAKLKGANFTNALLAGADLQGANLLGARFDGAVLVGAQMERALIEPAALQACLLDPSPAAMERGTELIVRLQTAGRWVASNGKEGAPAVLDGEDLRALSAAFARRQLTAMSAKGACGVGVDFSAAQLQVANFDGADLRDADFRGADLRGASFRGANLRHARFGKADLRPLPLPGGGCERSASIWPIARRTPSPRACVIRRRRLIRRREIA